MQSEESESDSSENKDICQIESGLGFMLYLDFDFDLRRIGV